MWTNKEISKFRFWASQQPNDWRNEDCVHTLGAKHGYTWNDVPCTNCYNYTCFKGNKRSTMKVSNRIYLNLHVPDSESTDRQLKLLTFKKVETQLQHVRQMVRQIA